MIYLRNKTTLKSITKCNKFSNNFLRDEVPVLYVYKGLSRYFNEKKPSSLNIDDELFFSKSIEEFQESSGIHICLNVFGGSFVSTFNLIKTVIETFNWVDFYIPHISASAGTLFCIPAKEVYMSRISYCTKIDPIIKSCEKYYNSTYILQTHKNGIIDWDPCLLVSAIESREMIDELFEYFLITKKINSDSIKNIKDLLINDQRSHDSPIKRNELRKAGLKIVNDHKADSNNFLLFTRQILEKCIHNKIDNFIYFVHNS